MTFASHDSNFEVLTFNNDGSINKANMVMDIYDTTVAIHNSTVWVDNGNWRFCISQIKSPLMVLRSGSLLLSDFRIMVQDYHDAQDAVFLLVQQIKERQVEYFGGIGAFAFDPMTGNKRVGILADTWHAYMDWLEMRIKDPGQTPRILDDWMDKITVSCPIIMPTSTEVTVSGPPIHLPDQSELKIIEGTCIDITGKALVPVAIKKQGIIPAKRKGVVPDTLLKIEEKITQPEQDDDQADYDLWRLYGYGC